MAFHVFAGMGEKTTDFIGVPGRLMSSPLGDFDNDHDWSTCFYDGPGCFDGLSLKVSPREVRAISQFAK